MQSFPKRLQKRWFQYHSICFAIFILMFHTGCDQHSKNLSPISDKNPERHARAIREVEEVEQVTKQAEADFFRRARLSAPEIEVEPEAAEVQNEDQSDFT